jgi:hypothetical protein
MNINMKLENSENGNIYDISELAFNIKWETSLLDQPGKLTFSCVNDDNVLFACGSTVTLIVDDKNIFYGYVFVFNKNDTDFIDVTCYDQTRYLQNTDVYVISGKTASQVFEMICKDFEIQNYNVVDATTEILPSRIYDNKTLYDIIKFGTLYELAKNNEWYIIRDNFGVLEFINIKKLVTKYNFDDETNVFNYNYETSIDSDSFNAVKIVQDNRVSKKGKPVKSGGTLISRDMGYKDNKSFISKWGGKLQYCEKSDKMLNPAQLQSYVEDLFNKKCIERHKYSLSTIGELDVQAGSYINIHIDKVSKDKNYQKFFITNCVHTFDNCNHTMELQLLIPEYGSGLK